MTDLYDDALAVLSSWTAPDDAQERLRQEYVAHLRSASPGLFKGEFPDHLTAGVLVLDRAGERVLLNLHRKAQRWFAFGGHLEAGDGSLLAAATREGVEESGLELAMDPVPVHLSCHEVDFCDERGTVRHLDVRFVARPADGPASDQGPVVSEESLDLRWFPVDDLPTDEPDMVDLIRLAVARGVRPL